MLYPPQIEGIIPSFTISEGSLSQIRLPFSMNRAVSNAEVAGFQVKIKNIVSNLVVLTKDSFVFDLEKEEVYFNLTSKERALFNVGQFYKIQLAYIDKNLNAGYFSSLSTIKCTSEPTLYIKDLDRNKINNFQTNFVGVYENKQDSTEKVSEYQFVLKDYNGNIIVDSGTNIHNNQKNISAISSEDTFTIRIEPEELKVYTIHYTIKTINGFTKSCSYQLISNNFNNAFKENISIVAENDFDNGCINLNITSNGELVQGNFIIKRSSEQLNYKEWEPVLTLSIKNKQRIKLVKKDFTIEQGRFYKYSIQKYNDFGILTDKKIYETPVLADFEDMFLTDGEKQLKIRFNPDVSSFKNNILEQKIETIGSKYAYFYRNPVVKYKEFPIKGLISYFMDEDNLFVRDEEIGLATDNYIREITFDLQNIDENISSLQEQLQQENENAFKQEIIKNQIKALKKQKNDLLPKLENDMFRTTNLTTLNFAAERRFKLAVLDWLDNGKPKMFRSPGEGNYIVRLSGTSLNPEQRIGRLLHNFSTVAYEIDEFNYDNLLKYNLIKVDELSYTHLLYKTFRLSRPGEKTNFMDDFGNYIDNSGTIVYKSGELLQGETVHYLLCENMLPETILYINDEQIVIGATGRYYAESEEGITSIVVEPNPTNQGHITIGYYGINIKLEKEIIKQDIEIHTIEQFFGPCEDLVEEKINNVKNKFQNFSFLLFKEKDVIKIAESDKESYIEKKFFTHFSNEKIYNYKPNKFYKKDAEGTLFIESAESPNPNEKYYLDKAGLNYAMMLFTDANGDYVSYDLEGNLIMEYKPNYFLNENNEIATEESINEHSKYKTPNGQPVRFMYYILEEDFLDNYNKENKNQIFYFKTKEIIENNSIVTLGEEKYYYKDPFNNKYYSEDEYDTSATYNDTTIDVKYDNIHIKNTDGIDKIQLGNAVSLVCGYMSKVNKYAIEEKEYYKIRQAELDSIKNKIVGKVDRIEPDDVKKLIENFQIKLAQEIIGSSGVIEIEKSEEYQNLVEQYNELMSLYEKVLNNIEINIYDYDLLKEYRSNNVRDTNNLKDKYNLLYNSYIDKLTEELKAYDDQ